MTISPLFVLMVVVVQGDFLIFPISRQGAKTQRNKRQIVHRIAWKLVLKPIHFA